MALASPYISSYAIDLDQAKDLIKILNITGVPVLFINQRRLNGPVNEWTLTQQLTL